MEKLKRILIAEDNPKDAELTKMALEESNFLNEIVHVKDGQEALDYFYYKGKFETRERGDPIVAFIDLKMPKVDGLQLVKQLKSDNDLKTIPLVVLTSSREERDLIESYKYGVNAYVVKPVDFEKFIAAVKQTGVFWAVINEVPQKI
ncbi:MAG: response regulator [Ignavibacteriaceae bacterium]